MTDSGRGLVAHSVGLIVDRFNAPGQAGGFDASSNWHHLAVTYDGSSVILYVDAQIDVSASLGLNTIGQSLEIGRSTMDRKTQEWFTGAIDDVRVYDRVLSGPEVALLFHEGGGLRFHEGDSRVGHTS